MRASLILSLAGLIVAFFGFSFILPILAGFLMGEEIVNLAWMFGFPMFLSIFFGGFLYNYFHTEEDIRNREAFVLVSFVWIIMVSLGAMPYVASEKMGLMSYEIGLVGALFESMSGLTTTGATVLEVPQGNEDKTSLLVVTKHEPGALFDLLEPFKSRKINMLQLARHPIPGVKWEYLFFIDIEGHQVDVNVKEAISEVEKQALKLNILGSYPVAIL